MINYKESHEVLPCDLRTTDLYNMSIADHALLVIQDNIKHLRAATLALWLAYKTNEDQWRKDWRWRCADYALTCMWQQWFGMSGIVIYRTNTYSELGEMMENAEREYQFILRSIHE